MRQMVCDGCGAQEPIDQPDSKKRIEPVVLKHTRDKRFPEGTDKYEADLCPACLALALHTYFKIPMEERLELSIPSWLDDHRREIREELAEETR